MDQMTSRLRRFLAAGTVLFLLLLSWLTISPGTPQIYAPFNLLVMIPAFVLEDGYMLAVAVVPLLFCLWCWPVLRGGTTLPTRSIVLLILAVALSATNLLFGYRYAIEYHGFDYVVGVATMNVVCWLLLGALALLATHRPDFRRNLAFHSVLFAWLAWCVFPYLGELP